MSSSKPVALVTGGSRGIGFGISLELAQHDFDLLIVGRKPEDAVATPLRKLRERFCTVSYVSADISDLSEHQAILQAARNSFGRLDVLVNNAGVAPTQREDLLEASPESFDRLININLKGPYFLTQKMAPWLAEQKRHHPERHLAVVFVTSISAHTVSVNRGDYCMSKAGLAMAAQLWATRLAQDHIPVYEVRPGIIQTDMTAGVQAKYDDLIANGLLLESRWGQPSDIGRAVAQLAVGNMPYATGQVLILDGGLSQPRL